MCFNQFQYVAFVDITLSFSNNNLTQICSNYTVKIRFTHVSECGLSRLIFANNKLTKCKNIHHHKKTLTKNKTIKDCKI